MRGIIGSSWNWLERVGRCWKKPWVPEEGVGSLEADIVKSLM